MDCIILVADHDASRREHLRHFFCRSGFLVAAASNGLDCLTEVMGLSPDVLIVAIEIPWGGGDGVIARLKDGLPIERHPLVLVMGSGQAEHLSVRSGVPVENCFAEPVQADEMLDRIGMELARQQLHNAIDGVRGSDIGEGPETFHEDMKGVTTQDEKADANRRRPENGGRRLENKMIRVLSVQVRGLFPSGPQTPDFFLRGAQ